MMVNVYTLLQKCKPINRPETRRLICSIKWKIARKGCLSNVTNHSYLTNRIAQPDIPTIGCQLRKKSRSSPSSASSLTWKTTCLWCLSLCWMRRISYLWSACTMQTSKRYGIMVIQVVFKITIKLRNTYAKSGPNKAISTCSGKTSQI